MDRPDERKEVHMPPTISTGVSEGSARVKAPGAFEEDVKKHKDESWTTKDLMEGLKLISKVTCVAGLGMGAAVGIVALSGGLLTPWAGPITIHSIAAASRAYEEASPRQKFYMRVASRALTCGLF
jgi:hypothetical protein